VGDHAPSAFEIVEYDCGDVPGLTVRGELDIASRPKLQLALDTAIRESVGAFVLDLCDVEFLDSSGPEPPAARTGDARAGRARLGDRVRTRRRPAPDGGRGRGRSLVPL
jgi:hypothetical protein